MQTSLNRLKEFIDYKGIAVSAFEKKIGYTNGALASQLKKNKTIGSDKLENILKEFPELSAHWLLTGQGKMLTSSSTNFETGFSALAKSNSLKPSDRQNVEIRHSRKLYRILENEYPHLYKIRIDLDTIFNFLDAAYEIDKVLGDKMREALWYYEGDFNFSRYQDHAIKTMEELLPYSDPLSKLTSAINAFYEEMSNVGGTSINFEDYTVD